MQHPIAKAMEDLLAEEPEEGKLFDWMQRHYDQIRAAADMAAGTEFHKISEARRAERIGQIDASDLSPQQRAEKAWLDLLQAVCDAPSFVPPECVAIANLPTVMKYLNAAMGKEAA